MELICIISVMQFNRRLTVLELESQTVDLKRWYMPIDLNPIHHNNKLESKRKLLVILKQANRRDFQKLSRINDIIFCALTLMYYFGMRFRLNASTSSYFTRRRRKRQFLEAETVFQKTLNMLLPERSEATTSIMLTFFADASLWHLENFAVETLKIAVNLTRKETTVFHLLLSDAPFPDDVPNARHRLGVLYELLNCEHIIFQKWNLVFPFMNRLLDYYAYELNDGSDTSHYYNNLRKEFESCLCRLLERVDSQHRVSIFTTLMDWFMSLAINDDYILKLSGILLHAAALYKVDAFSESVPDDLVDSIVNNFLASTKPLLNLFGCRIILHLMDRHHNAQYIVEPKLYYEVTTTQLKIGPSTNIDQLFVKHHGGKFHRNFMMGLKSHCEQIANMKAMFSVLCCYILEVPCGVTATAAACTMMTVQDYALNGEHISPRCRYWMHAVVISVMSLICWVHKAPVLRLYVNQIITRRAIEAPHLNPPLLQEYNVKHLKPWSRKTLFFEDWEMRYGLWKAFEVPPVSIMKHMKKMKTDDHKQSRVWF